MNREDLQEIEDMVADLPEWEQDARRIVYSYTYNPANFHSVYTFLAKRVPSWKPVSDEVPELRIADYYRYMQPFAVQDRRDGLDASFAIEFIGAVNDSLYTVGGIHVRGSLKNLLDQGEQVMAPINGDRRRKKQHKCMQYTVRLTPERQYNLTFHGLEVKNDTDPEC